MTAVTFRRMRFDVDSDVPFQWNPANPGSGLMANMISFIAVGFERYLVLAVKDALRTMTDEDLRAEAEVFLAQESQHSAAHRRHVNGLIAQYPGLGPVLDRVVSGYEELFAAQPLKFHLAYIASLEATFPPLFTFMIENRDRLYNGDTRVASLFLWHYVEEIEHRSSAQIVFDGVVASRWYQMRMLPRSMSHILAVSRELADGFREAVPEEDMGVDPRVATGEIWRTETLTRLPVVNRFFTAPYRTTFEGIPSRQLLRLVAGLVRSQSPTHHPGDVVAPDWFHTWMDSYAAGEDMAHFYGVGSAPAARG
ncbi:metal-dependent hydrolase [Aldersonia kunmingensis]|uniref:metal-dependent hydrolase n=1 Tax=Aldersonia kunmingensis TaxID=408066 RepID=UPI000835BF4E|nr:metal-dependent hydrolase [Aldersonia kunmingensis]